MVDKEQGWLSARLEELLIHVIGGDWGKGDDYVDDDFETVSCIRGSEFKNWKTELGATAVTRRIKSSSLATRQLVDGDLLIEISGGGPDQPVGRTVLITEQVLGRLSYPAVCTNFLRLARPSNYFNSAFLNHYLAKFYNSGEVVNYQGGSNNLRNLKFKEYSKIEIPIPPLTEQKVIADKLDTLLAQVETTKARLERIPEILKTFRQSVLAAAMNGKLTENWREINKLDLDSWSDGVLGDFVEKPTYGSSSKSQAIGAVPVLRMGNLQNGKLDWTNLVYTSDPAEIEKYKLSYGDVLFNRTNSPELVGKTSIYHGEREAIYAGYLIRIVCKENLNPEYLNYLLNSPDAKEYCYQVKSDGVSQSNINAQKLKAYPISVPTVKEQIEIVRRVEELFAFADSSEQKANTALERVNNLTQSILAKAFRGQLTADWREANPGLITGENSAESLLRRITAEQKKLLANKPRRRKRCDG